MFERLNLLSAIWSVMVMLTLAGCAPGGSSSGYIPFYRMPNGVTKDEAYDLMLQHVETSPVPGATARVMPPPPGIVYSGAAVGNCVTEAGYCPLAAQTEPGQNCLCTAAKGTYGGTTGIPPKFDTTTNPIGW